MKIDKRLYKKELFIETMLPNSMVNKLISLSVVQFKIEKVRGTSLITPIYPIKFYLVLQ